MKTIFRTFARTSRARTLGLMILCAASILLSRADSVPENALQPSGTPYVIGISPFLDPSVKDDVYRSTIRLIVQHLPNDSSLSVYDAFHLKTITRLRVPDTRAFTSPKTRANQFAPAIRDLKEFLAQEHSRPGSLDLNFDGAVRLPQFLDFLVETLPPSESGTPVLMLGSPLYMDEREPAFSMVDGYFPSDGHLQASRDESVFGLSGDPGKGSPLVIHWSYFSDPWISDLHQEKVTRFWNLYLARRNAQLAVFTGDLPTALRSFGQRAVDDEVHSLPWTVDAGHTKIEMLRLSRAVGIADWLTNELSVAQQPPTVLVGPMKIGIRWEGRIDLDLYATPRAGAETLFFNHVRSPEGYYYKDHRSSPGREYEFIEFESAVNVREVEAFVNIYEGSCPGGIQGEVRIEFDGRIYGAPFSIPASRGNFGRLGASQDKFWTAVPIQRLLKLDAVPIQTALGPELRPVRDAP